MSPAKYQPRCYTNVSQISPSYRSSSNPGVTKTCLRHHRHTAQVPTPVFHKSPSHYRRTGRLLSASCPQTPYVVRLGKPVSAAKDRNHRPWAGLFQYLKTSKTRQSWVFSLIFRSPLSRAKTFRYPLSKPVVIRLFLGAVKMGKSPSPLSTEPRSSGLTVCTLISIEKLIVEIISNIR